MTLQQTVERRPKKIDLNLLPPEFRPVKKSKLGLILSLTIIVLIVAMVFMIITKSSVNSDRKSLITELTGLQTQLLALQANKNQADSIKSQITATEAQLDATIADDKTFHNDSIIWSQVVTEIDDLIPSSKITLDSITVATDRSISLPGTSTKKMYVYDLLLALNESDFFTVTNFNFGDCQQTGSCGFSITVSVNNASQMGGAANE